MGPSVGVVSWVRCDLHFMAAELVAEGLAVALRRNNVSVAVEGHPVLFYSCVGGVLSD